MRPVARSVPGSCRLFSSAAAIRRRPGCRGRHAGSASSPGASWRRSTRSPVVSCRCPTCGASPGGEIPDFAAVYSAAGISDPPHGYSAFKVLEILSSLEFANLDSRAKAAALAGFLKMNPSGPVPISDVVQDAVRRDQALDKFEDFLRTKLKARAEQIEKENHDLQAEIDALATKNREAMEANRKTLAAEEERLARWQVRKRIEERRLFDAVSPFVETNPITTGDAKPAAAPSQPASE